MLTVDTVSYLLWFGWTAIDANSSQKLVLPLVVCHTEDTAGVRQFRDPGN